MTTRKFKVWLDSGAAHDSRYETTVTLEEIGIASYEWDVMSDESKDETMRNVAFENSDWGYLEETP